MIPAACDLNMTSSEKGWLNAIIFVGMMIGGHVFGGAADIKVYTYLILDNPNRNETSEKAQVFEMFSLAQNALKGVEMV